MAISAMIIGFSFLYLNSKLRNLFALKPTIKGVKIPVNDVENKNQSNLKDHEKITIEKINLKNIHV